MLHFICNVFQNNFFFFPFFFVQKYSFTMDDFDLISVIGSGTCGEVSKMKHNPTGKILAVKVSYG